MKVRTIGTGNLWGKYNSASYLIDDKILVDMPNGSVKDLYKIDIKPYNINHVLITHFHGDHYFDIPFYLLNKNKFKQDDVNIYCSKNGPRKIYKLLKLAFPYAYYLVRKNIKIKFCYENNFTIDNFHIEKYLVRHGLLKPSYGYLVKEKNKTVGFTGDTSLCSNVMKLAEQSDYLFCDCSYLEGDDRHMGIDNILYLADVYPNCKFVVSHMSDKSRKEISKLKIKNIIVPKDYDIYNI